MKTRVTSSGMAPALYEDSVIRSLERYWSRAQHVRHACMACGLVPAKSCSATRGMITYPLISTRSGIPRPVASVAISSLVKRVKCSMWCSPRRAQAASKVHTLSGASCQSGLCSRSRPA